MSEPTLLQRCAEIRTRAARTDQLSVRDVTKVATQIVERRELLALLRTIEERYRTVSEMLHGLAEATTRGPNGHAWKHDLPPKANPTEFYQCLRALIRYMRDSSG